MKKLLFILLFSISIFGFSQSKKISELNSVTTLDGTEIIPVVQGGETKKATVGTLAAKSKFTNLDQSGATIYKIGDTFLYNNLPWIATQNFNGNAYSPGTNANVIIVNTSNYVQNAGGTSNAAPLQSYTWAVFDDIYSRIGSNGTGAPIAGTGAGGSGKVVTMSGTDAGGYLQILAGASPATSAVVVTYQFSAPYSFAPSAVIISPGNANAAALGSATLYVSSISASAFSLAVGTTALTTGQTYRFYFHVIP